MYNDNSVTMARYQTIHQYYEQHEAFCPFPEVTGDMKYFSPSCYLDTIRWDLIVRGKVLEAKTGYDPYCTYFM